jgi:hypothetical protein
LYLNICGLDAPKLRYIENLIDETSSSTVFIIAEHWFSKFTELKESRYFCCSTPLEKVRDTGHQNGGLAMLASRALISHIHDLSVTEFSITFSISSERIKAVYLPPRLTLNEVADVISPGIEKISILMGDINVRFGKMMQDKRTWNMERGQMLISLLDSYGIYLRQSNSKFSGNDHVFSQKDELWNYKRIPTVHFRTDHGLIELLTPIEKHIHHISIIGQEKRYAFSLLKDPVMRSVIEYEWLKVQPLLIELIGKIRYKMQMGCITSYNSAIEVVNIAYETIIGAILNLCEKNFPQYDPEAIKSKRDASQDLNNANCSSVFAIRTFKRSQRMYAQSRKFKALKDTDVLVEAVEYYSKIYSTQETTSCEGGDDLISNKTWQTDSDEVSTIIKKYSSAKSAGPDGIPIILIKQLNMQPGFSTLIAEFFNICLEFSITPKSWNTSRIHLLMKDPLMPFISSSRPVSLTCVFRRLYEKIILRHALKEPWSQLNNNQAGFRKGWSTISHILLNDDMCRNNFNISAYLDLKSAFDVVNHQYLLDTLKRKGTPFFFIRMIYSLMIKDCDSTISVNGILSPSKIYRSRGLFQGSILSPVLFNIIIDTLADQICEQLPSSTTILLFADDIVLKTNNWDHLQQALDICYNWSDNSKIDWGIKKCGILCKHESFPMILGNDIVPLVSEYKYLGIPFTAKGVHWRQYLTAITDKHRKFLNGIMIQSQRWTMHTRLVIYRSFIRPILEYCLPLLTKWIYKQKDKNELIDALLITYKEGIQWIIGRERSFKILEFLTGLGSFHFRILQLEASMANHLDQLRDSNPLKTYMTSHYISNNINFILTDCRKSQILTQWKVYRNNEAFPVKYQTWLKHKRSAEYDLLPSKLIHYILPRCRLKSGADNLLKTIYPISYQAVLWRTNSSFIKTTCPECCKKFNRGHLKRCGLYSHFKDIFIKDLESKTFKDDIKKINSIKLQDGDNYTLLDFYLNNCDYEKFGLLYEDIKKLLSED